MADYFMLQGNLTRKPELRETSNGKPVTNLDIAVNKFKGESCFFQVAVWDKQAETASNFLDKGSPVLVEGHLGMTPKKEGEYPRVSLTASRVHFLPKGGKKGEVEQAEPNTDDVPF